MAATETPTDSSNHDRLELQTARPGNPGGSREGGTLCVNIGPQLKTRILELQKSTGMTQMALVTRLLEYALDHVRLTP